MKKVTIITGEHASGKTTLAKKLCENKKAVWLSSLDIEKVREVEFDTEIIVIDGLAIEDMEKLKMLITTETFIATPKFKKEFFMERPEVIVTTNCFTKEDFIQRQHIEFIEMIRK